MLRIPDPAAAIVPGLGIGNGIMRQHVAPAVRVGFDHGPDLERDGDYVGAAVNLAARVSGQVVGGEVLMTAHTAALAGELDCVFYEAPRTPAAAQVREPVALVAAVPADVQPTPGMAIGSICQMAVDRARHRPARLRRDGVAPFRAHLRGRLGATPRALRAHAMTLPAGAWNGWLKPTSRESRRPRSRPR